MWEPERLEQLFNEGRISRRDFVKRMSALGLGALLTPALLSTPDPFLASTEIVIR